MTAMEKIIAARDAQRRGDYTTAAQLLDEVIAGQNADSDTVCIFCGEPVKGMRGIGAHDGCADHVVSTARISADGVTRIESAIDCQGTLITGP